jgi:hypothetical protein
MKVSPGDAGDPEVAGIVLAPAPGAAIAATLNAAAAADSLRISIIISSG